MTFEDLSKRFNTVGAHYHDAYAEWQVMADPQRRTLEDCRYVGWGWTLQDAVDVLEVVLLEAARIEEEA